MCFNNLLLLIGFTQSLQFLVYFSYKAFVIESHEEYSARHGPIGGANINSYHNYLKHFNKSVPHRMFEERIRQFEKTKKMIEWQNRGSQAEFGLTKFADWTEEEIASMLLPYQGGCEEMHQDNCRTWSNRRFSTRKSRVGKIIKLKDKVDWRRKGAVGPVLDQKYCPVCWAFSIVGVIESMAAIRSKHFRSLSIQEVIDCSFSRPSNRTGCRTGRPLVYAMKYLCDKQMKITNEAKYPLTLADEDCDVDARNTGYIRVRSFKNNCHLENNEKKILELLNRGPVTALVHARYLMNYVRGIIHVNCGTTVDQLDHAVQLVGYDTTGETPYYILKNSWGADWGEGGYARLAIQGNQCGVAFSIGSMDVA